MCSDNNSTDVTLTENPSCRYALHDVICDLTIEELESVVGYMQDVEGVLQSSPFPHVEIDTSYGDIIIYDRNSIHGVEEIDPHKKLEIDTFSGRVTAFVSLYKAL